MPHHRLILSLLLLFSPAGVWAQSARSVIAAAASKGLPTRALENKLREGRVKKVPAARIVAVLEALSLHMERSRFWLKKDRPAARIDDALLASLAEARLARVREKTLRRMLARSRGPGALRRVAALTDLTLRGYQADAALAAVLAVPSNALAGLGRHADRLRRSGFSRKEVLDVLLRASRSRQSVGRRPMRAVGTGYRGKPPAKPKPKKPPKRPPPKRRRR